jgi:fumarate reductase subunit D
MSQLTHLLHVVAQLTNPFPKVQANNQTIRKVMQFVFALIGAISLIVIIVAGLRFSMSQGEPQNSNKARNAIIYAAVGLVIAISATIIVDFVVLRVSS